MKSSRNQVIGQGSIGRSRSFHRFRLVHLILLELSRVWSVVLHWVARYGADGFMQLLASNGTLASQQIQQLRTDARLLVPSSRLSQQTLGFILPLFAFLIPQGFLDAATRAFFAEFNIWNSNVGLCACSCNTMRFGVKGL